MAQYDPAVHAVHSLNPVDAAKVPNKQFEQLDEDADEANVPTGQNEQTVAEAAEYFPVAQLPLTADNPAMAQYDPAGHTVHELNPDEAA